jgi:hypothetical protein
LAERKDSTTSDDFTELERDLLQMVAANELLLAAAKQVVTEYRLGVDLTGSCRALEAAIEIAEGGETPPDDAPGEEGITPLPWTIWRDGGGGVNLVNHHGAYVALIGREDGTSDAARIKADAAFILTAVHAYERAGAAS